MHIRIATYADRDKWDDYVMNHPEGTAYHLFAWKEAVEQAYGFMGTYLLAETESGLCGVLPLIDFRIPLVSRTLISLPYCDAGGVLFDSHGAEQALIDFARSLAEDIQSDIKLRATRPLHSFGQNQTDKVSMVLDLPNNSNDLLNHFKSKFRLKVKKPSRDGVTVKLGSMELLDEFYSVFARNMRHLGSPVHSRLWFRAVVSAYGEKAMVAVAYMPDRTPAAAGIVLLHPSRVSNPWASSLRQYNNMRPNMLLYWTFLAFAADNNYRHFDFGRSTPGQGTYSFKEQWGARPQPLYWYDLPAQSSRIKTSQGKLYQVNSFSKRDLVASLWQKLPQSGTDWLGPKVRKYISL